MNRREALKGIGGILAAALLPISIIPKSAPVVLNPSIETLIMQDLAEAMSLAIDKAVCLGITEEEMKSSLKTLTEG